MNDIKLLAAMTDKETCESISNFVGKDVVHPDTHNFILALKSYFAVLGKTGTSLDFDEFEEFIAHTQPVSIKKAVGNLANNIAAELKANANSPVKDYIVTYYLDLKLAMALRNQAEDFILGNLTSMQDSLKEMEEYKNRVLAATALVEDPFISTDIAELIKNTVGASGLNWRLPELNQILGPIRKGDLLIVAARPETGKTTLLASEVSHMAKQLPKDRPVLWLCNEEDGKRVQLRVYQAALGKTKDELLKNPSKTEKEVVDELGSLDKVKVLFNPYLTTKQIELVCKEINPGLIIIDQLDKVSGMKGDRPDLMLKALYQWARVLANAYGPTLVVCQADASAEGQRWLYQNQLDGSKTAKQGEADAILMIGKDNDPALEFERYLHVPKNKLGGGPLSIEALRHGRAEVIIKPEIARYE